MQWELSALPVFRGRLWDVSVHLLQLSAPSSHWSALSAETHRSTSATRCTTLFISIEFEIRFVRFWAQIGSSLKGAAMTDLKQCIWFKYQRMIEAITRIWVSLIAFVVRNVFIRRFSLSSACVGYLVITIDCDRSVQLSDEKSNGHHVTASLTLMFLQLSGQ